MESNGPAYNPDTMTTDNVGKAVMVPALGNIYRNRIVKKIVDRHNKKKRKKNETKRKSHQND
jgi:hypothetical protein